jgi:hypothetical protein
MKQVRQGNPRHVTNSPGIGKWRRRDLNPCYRRESGRPNGNCRKLQEHGRTGRRSNRGKKHLNVSPMCPPGRVSGTVRLLCCGTYSSTWSEHGQFAESLFLHGATKLHRPINHPQFWNDLSYELSMTEKADNRAF